MSSLVWTPVSLSPRERWVSPLGASTTTQGAPLTGCVAPLQFFQVQTTTNSQTLASKEASDRISHGHLIPKIDMKKGASDAGMWSELCAHSISSAAFCASLPPAFPPTHYLAHRPTQQQPPPLRVIFSLALPSRSTLRVDPTARPWRTQRVHSLVFGRPWLW